MAAMGWEADGRLLGGGVGEAAIQLAAELSADLRLQIGHRRLYNSL